MKDGQMTQDGLDNDGTNAIVLASAIDHLPSSTRH
jgi:hypothetical protein